MKTFVHFGILGALFLCLFQTPVFAAGTVTTPDEASLRAAMVGGGTVTFDCDGTITLASQINLPPSQSVVLDASGHAITLSGANAVHLFNINPGASLTLINLTIANGRNQGTNAAAGANGGQGSGGAINVDNGTLNLIACRIWTNTAVGGAGGNGHPHGGGGLALGGAIYLLNGTMNATNSEFVGNLTVGGAAGTNILDQISGPAGGKSAGGAIYSRNSQLNLDDCTFMINKAVGGIAHKGQTTGNDGVSGDASGGAWFNDGGTSIVTRCSFTLNSGTTPQPTGSIAGGGGAVRGGAFCNLTGLVSIADTEFANNKALGGQARRHALPAGPGQGGAICNYDSLNVTRCRFQDNSANGGNDGNPAGDGLGGAIFNAGQIRITQSEFRANTAKAGEGYHGGLFIGASGIAGGGGIFTTNLLALNESTLSGNVVYGAAGGVAFGGPYAGYPAYGGAIYSTGSSYLTNNTLAGNLARGGPWVGSPGPPGFPTFGGDAYGGGFCGVGGIAFLLNNTLVANAAQGGTGFPSGSSNGGGIANQNGSVTLLNTIVANSPSGSNAFGTLTDAGNNMSSDASCAFSADGSLNDTDPKLGPLGDYDGPTATMPLLAGSPAIDGGDGAIFPPIDQRGRTRPYGGAPDIGAFESSPPFVVRGKVSGATLKEEVSITTGTTNMVTTNGDYGFSLSPSTYSITPQSPNYLFVPTNRSITIGPDQLNVDFKAYRWNALSLESANNGVLHLAFAGTNGASYRVLASTNLVDWLAVSTNSTGTSNLFEFFDPTIRSNQMRFYRIASP